MYHGLPMVLAVKNTTYQSRRHRDKCSIPGSERSPGAGNGNLLQYYYLGNFMEREA